MPLPSSPNSISMAQINAELAKTVGSIISLNDALVRSLFAKTTTISFSDGWGKSKVVKVATPVVTVSTGAGSVRFDWSAVAGGRYWIYLNGSTTAVEVLTNYKEITGLGNNVSQTIRVYITKTGDTTSDLSPLVAGTSWPQTSISGLTGTGNIGRVVFSWNTEVNNTYYGSIDGNALAPVTSPVTYVVSGSGYRIFNLEARRTNYVTSTASVGSYPASVTALTVRGTPVAGNAAVENQYYYYSFVADYSVSHSVAMNKTGSSNIDAYLYIYDANMNYITSDDDTGGSLNSLATFNATAGATYYIRAYSIVNTGSYAISVNRAAITLATPVFTAASGGMNTASFSWGAVSLATSYDVTFNGNTINQTSTSFTTSVATAGNYTLSVVAKSNTEISSNSATSSTVTVTVLEKPGQTTNSYSNLTYTSVTITVSTTSGGTPGTYYLQYRNAANTWVAYAENSTGVFPNIGVSYPNYYDFRSYAGNTAGQSTLYSNIMRIEPAIAPPGQVTLSYSNLTSTNVDITITKGTGGEPSTYYLYYQASNGVNTLYNLNSTGIFTGIGITYPGYYVFRGYAGNASLVSPAWSADLPINTPAPAIIPSVPAISFSNVTSSGFNVNLSGTNILNYYLYTYPDYVSLGNNTTGVFAFSGQPSTTYSFRAFSQSSTGQTSAWSSVASQPTSAAAVIGTLNVSFSGITSGSATVSLSYTGTYSISNYSIYLYTSLSNNQTAAASYSGASSTHVFSGLNPSTAYYAYVSAQFSTGGGFDKAMNSADSFATSAAVPITPSAPTLTVSNLSATQFDIQMTATNANNYLLYEYVAGTWTYRSSSSNGVFNIPGKTPSTRYYFYGIASNNGVNSISSAMLIVDTTAGQATPGAITATAIAAGTRTARATGTTMPVWYSFTPTTAGNYTFVLSSAIDTFVEIYNSTGTTMLFFDDDAGYNTNSQATGSLNANTTYLIKARGFTVANSGAHELSIYGGNCTAITTTGTTQGAVSVATSNVTYRFSPTVTKTYQFALTGAIGDTFMLMYDHTGNLLIQDDDSGGASSALFSYGCLAGLDYYIKCMGYNTQTGVFNLTIT